MKHILDYTREDILKCFYVSDLPSNYYPDNGKELKDFDTETLRQWLSDAIRDGDAPTLEDV